jgi:hypothetical protein
MSPNRPLPVALLALLNLWVREDGPEDVARAVGTSVTTVYRANARVPLAPLTRAAFERALASRGSRAADNRQGEVSPAA